MKKIVIGILFGTVAMAATAFSANAQAIRTWVSGVGDDANACSRTAPCKTFAGAIAKTAAGGEINCLDSGGFGAVTITKSMDIICEGTIGGITYAGTSAVIINAGASDVVVLKGLDLEGGGSAVLGLNGIRFLAGAALHVEDCIIRNSHAGAPNGNGILFAPSAGTAELTVRNTTIANNGAAASGAGIHIRPTGSGSVKAVLENVIIENNQMGVLIDGAGSSGAITVNVRDSTIGGSATQGFGVFEATSGAPSAAVLERTTISSNAFQGVVASQALASVRVRQSAITGNGAGVLSLSGGEIISHGDNVLAGNTTNGAFTSTVAPQ